MLKRFVFDQEDRPGAAWAARFEPGAYVHDFGALTA